ncbi:type II toxin-antitoxin system RelE/ParE family toxin [Nostoc sp.]|uniref:type II toxin-antitoxin system RelE/ParE family toxin n=1 Tax=Nostoc sp. TaxID=1180 RepID=UPI002FFC49A9
MEYFIAKEASQELDEILDYFIVRNINAGERFIQKFNNKWQNITQFANIGRSYAKFDLSLRGCLKSIGRIEFATGLFHSIFTAVFRNLFQKNKNLNAI